MELWERSEAMRDFDSGMSYGTMGVVGHGKVGGRFLVELWEATLRNN